MNTNKHYYLTLAMLYGLNKQTGLLVARRHFLSSFLFYFFVLISVFGSKPLVAQNSPPLVDTLTYCTGPMTPVVLCNSYTDPNGDNVVVIGGHTTFNCSLVFLNDTCVRYTPLPGFIGTDIVYLDVCDDQTPAACSVTVIYVHVGCLPPIAYNDQAFISGNNLTLNGIAQPLASGNTFVLPVLSNDDPLCINKPVSVAVVLSAPNFGTYSIASDGSALLYTPNNGYSGIDAITYVACNNCPLCDTATVQITVAPVTTTGCNPDIYVCVPPLSALDICPEFCDIDNTAITGFEYTASNGNLSPPDPDGCLTYTAANGFLGEDILSITACDTQGNCSTTFAFITVSTDCGAAPPVALNDAITTPLNTSATVNVLNNDYDPAGQTLTITALTQPSNGTASIGSGGNILYFPASGFSGSDSFTYTICNTSGNCATATVSIQVIAPCANFLQTCTSQATPVEFCVDFCGLQGLGLATIANVTASYNSSISQMPGNCIEYTPLPLFTGTDTVQVIACTATGFCDTAFVAILVGCNAPDALDDVTQTAANTPVSIAVTNNDVAFCNDDLEVAINTVPGNGTATVMPDGSISYLPNSGFSGQDVFQYTVCSPCSVSACKTAQVTVTVSPLFTPEFEDYLAQPDVVTTPFGTSVNIPVLDNDLGTDLQIVSYSLASNGIVVPNTDGTFTYIPSSGFSGVDYFFYQVCNAEAVCQQTIVAVTVLPSGTAPQAPVAANDMAETPLNTAIVINVLSNDSDPEGQALTITNAINPNNGTVMVNPGGTITYTPNAGFSGIDHFTYTICDAQSLCDEATVSVAVGGVPPSNQYPFADNDHAQTMPSLPVNILLFSNDIEPDGNPLTATILSNPVQGSVTVNPNTGIATYTPNAGFQGVDYFTYMACDNGSPILCDTAYVSITVGNGNVPPVAQDDTAFGMENATVFILVILNDSDLNNPLADLTITSLPVTPQNGTATINGLQIIYVPNPGFTGTDQFTYLLCDPAGDCDEATVTVIINAGVLAQPDAVSTNQNTQVSISVVANDQGANISISSTSTPDNGSIATLPSGIIVYTPNPGFSGTDMFTYTICDNVGNCSETTVTITVIPDDIDLPPNAQNDIAITTLNTPVQIPVLDNDTDPEGLTLSITTATQPQNGTSIIEGTSITYFPNPGYTGTDIFTYVICNTNGLCDTASVAINVSSTPPTGQPPVAVDDVAETELNSPVSIAVLANDSDPDGDVITILLVNSPANGTVNTVGDSVLYTPNANFSGTDVFTYIVTDLSGNLATATVTVTVLPAIPDVVLAQNDTTETSAGEAVFIAVLTNDLFNPDAGQPQIAILNLPQNGTALVDITANNITYVPNSGFSGPDVFTYTLCVNSICDTASVIVLVTGVVPCEDGILTVSSGFSPNGDGVNDLFLISGADDPCFESFNLHLLIFNRWGDVMYSASPYNNTKAWNGLWQGTNAEAPTGTYFYVLQYINQNLEPVKLSGYIELVR